MGDTHRSREEGYGLDGKSMGLYGGNRHDSRIFCWIFPLGSDDEHEACQRSRVGIIGARSQCAHSVYLGLCEFSVFAELQMMLFVKRANC